MTARSTKSNLTLPPGLSPSEEGRWWDEHHEYWDTVEEPDEVVPPMPIRRTGPVNLRLPVDMIDALKGEATRRGLAYHTLIHMWLKERLDREATS